MFSAALQFQTLLALQSCLCLVSALGRGTFFQNKDTIFLANINFPNKTRRWNRYGVQLQHNCVKKIQQTVSVVLWFTQMKGCMMWKLLSHTQCTFSPKSKTEIVARKGPFCQRVRFLPHLFHKVCPTPELCSKRRINCTNLLIGEFMKRPSGGECIDIKYPPHVQDVCSFRDSYCGSVRLNNRVVHKEYAYRWSKNVIYSFMNIVLFHMNVTFVRFQLSGPCWGCGKMTCFSDNEFVWISRENQNFDSFFYCMTRPLWSVFPGNKFSIYYNPCALRGKICHGKSSSLFFQYQVLEKHIQNTENDFFHMVLNHRIGSLEYSRAIFFGWRLLSYFLQVNKYEQMMLSFKADAIPFLSELCSKEKLLTSQQGKILLVLYFQCFVKVISSKFTRRLNFSQTSMTIVRRNVSEQYNTLVFAHMNGSEPKPHHTVFCFSSDKNAFLTFEFNTLGYEPLPLCFHGGISVFDSLNNTEIYSICHNLPDERRQVSFTSASEDTLLIVFMSHTGCMNFSLSVQPTPCRGLFINICHKLSYPTEYFSWNIYPLYSGHTTNLVLFAKSLALNNQTKTCVTYQLGTQYLQPPLLQKIFDCKLTFYFAENRQTGNRGNPHQVNLSYHVFFGKEYRRLLPNIQDKTELGDNFFFLNRHTKVKPKQDRFCEEEFMTPGWKAETKYSLPRNLRIPHGVFNTMFRILPVTQREKRFEVEIFFQKVKKNRHQDLLLIKESGLSSHVRSLTLTHTPRGFVVDESFKPRIFSAQNQSSRICLKEHFRKVIRADMMLSLQAHGSFASCSLGHFNMSLTFCRDEYWFSQILQLDGFNLEHLGLPTCVRSDYGDHKEKIVWTSVLTSQMFLIDDDVVHVSLPGKPFDAVLLPSGESCCMSQTCFMSFMWRKIKHNVKRLVFSMEDFVFPHKWQEKTRAEERLPRLFFPVQKLSSKGKGRKIWRHVLHPSFLKSQQKTKNWGRLTFDEKLVEVRKMKKDWMFLNSYSWKKAKNLCEKKQSSLPTFLSLAEVEAFKVSLRSWELQRPFSSIFIGLQMKVLFGSKVHMFPTGAHNCDTNPTDAANTNQIYAFFHKLWEMLVSWSELITHNLVENLCFPTVFHIGTNCITKIACITVVSAASHRVAIGV